MYGDDVAGVNSDCGLKIAFCRSGDGVFALMFILWSMFADGRNFWRRSEAVWRRGVEGEGVEGVA